MSKANNQAQVARIILGLARRARVYDYFSPLRLAHRKSLQSLGWQDSHRTRESIDADGNPIPWFSYSMIHFLSSREFNGLSLFEYGMGNSTRWWLSRGANVTAVDNHEGWFEMVNEEIGDQASLMFRERGNQYVKSIAEAEQKFDIVVVDGHDRVQCAIEALNHLAPNGVIVWDDTSRERYQPGFDALTEAGFRRIEFLGLAPIGASLKRTSVFYRDENVLGI